ncbi:MAG: hypothetical protein FJY98_03980 [Candidatus Liptonbacteria bacterium]|nr:hypothetical protein [Candidatus Liptonbacteria bacterium]
MENKKVLVAGVVGIVVLTGIAFLAASKRPASPSPVGAGKVIPPEKQLPLGESTRTAAPQNIVVPDEKTTGAAANVAIPKTTGPGDVANTSTFRSYEIKVEKNKFIPDTVIVKQGDAVKIEFLAVDKEYDVTQADYGFKLQLPKGVKKTLGFSAAGQGDFLFYCTLCGGPEEGPKGHIIVTSPKQ